MQYISYGKANDFLAMPIMIGEETQRFKKDGLVINIPEDKEHATSLEIAVENNRKYELHYYYDGEMIGKQPISRTDTSGMNLSYHLDIPGRISKHGFDQIHLVPYSRGAYFYLGYLILNE